MTDFINYCREYKWYVVALVAFAVVFVFVLKKTAKAYKNYYKNYRSEESRMKRLVSLKERFKDLAVETIANEKEDELLEGVALCYQLKLQKLDDMEKEFATYNPEKKYIYALDVFVQSESAGAFFKENGSELTEILIPALDYIGIDSEEYSLGTLQLMYDEKDETTSISYKVIEDINNYAKDNSLNEKIKHQAAEKIKDDAEKFVFNVN